MSARQRVHWRVLPDSLESACGIVHLHHSTGRKMTTDTQLVTCSYCRKRIAKDEEFNAEGINIMQGMWWAEVPNCPCRDPEFFGDGCTTPHAPAYCDGCPNCPTRRHGDEAHNYGVTKGSEKP